MKKIVVASMQPGAGKTSIIAGIAQNTDRTFTYIKPFGDRMVYLKKRLWDQDAALITQVFDIDQDPEDLSIGFEHTKLRYMHDEAGIREKLQGMIGTGSEVTGSADENTVLVFVEGGKDLQYGASVHLDPISLARFIDAELIVVLSGDDPTIMDDLTHLSRNLDLNGIRLLGVIFNKVQDVDDFRGSYLSDIELMGIDVLGIVPIREELTHLTLGNVAKSTMAKVIAGENGLNNTIKHIFVGAMSVNLAQRNPLFRKDKKLIITSGDRSDMILAAIESNSAGIILTNNIVPNSTMISKASERNIPLMVVPQDTYTIAMLINRMEPVISKNDTEKLAVIAGLARDHIDIDRILKE